MQATGRRPRVLVTDAEGRSALAACRGLAAAGYDVAAAGSRRLAVSFWSRACRESVRLPDPRDDGAAYAERLADELRRRRYDVLLPGSEASLLPISKFRAALEPHAALGLPPHETVLRSLNKTALTREAVRAGLSPPPTVVCSSEEEALEGGRRIGYPVVVKPQRSFAENALGRLEQGNVAVASSERELVRAAARAGTPLLVQQFVARPRILFCAAVCAGDRQFLGFTVAHIESTWPREAGTASTAVTIEPPPRLEERVRELVFRLGWIGIFQLQLLDLGAGRFAVIDLNPRVFASMTLAVRAGANLPALWCDHLLGRRSARAETARPGVSYRCDGTELYSVVRNAWRGEWRTALSELRLEPQAVHPYFELRDPAPLAARTLDLVASGRRWRALLQRSKEF